MAASDALTYLPPEKDCFNANLAAIFAQKKNPLAEVEIFYHKSSHLSIVFLKKVFSRYNIIYCRGKYCPYCVVVMGIDEFVGVKNI